MPGPLPITVTHRPARVWLVLGAAALLVGGCSVGSPPAADDGGGAGATAEVVGATGEHLDVPVEVLGDGAPADVLALIAEAAEQAERSSDGIDDPVDRVRARIDAAVAVLTDAGEPLIRPRSAVGAAIVPARGDSVCSASNVLAALEADDGALDAFALAAGVAPDALDDHLDSLTPGFLIHDADAVNHTWRRGRLSPYRAVLRAGTAVLVDADGLPRVRCRSATPLLPVWIEVDDLVVDRVAFADRVEEADIGAEVPAAPFESIDGVFTDRPDAALGPPDGVAVSLGDAVTGGCANRIVVELTDNRLVDGPGPDLLLVELGEPETVTVAVGVTADELRPVGDSAGGTATIDLAAAVEPGERIAFVELCDGPETSTEVAGTDIDAIAALNSVDPRS